MGRLTNPQPSLSFRMIQFPDASAEGRAAVRPCATPDPQVLTQAELHQDRGLQLCTLMQLNYYTGKKPCPDPPAGARALFTGPVGPMEFCFRGKLYKPRPTSYPWVWLNASGSIENWNIIFGFWLISSSIARYGPNGCVSVGTDTE